MTTLPRWRWPPATERFRRRRLLRRRVRFTAAGQVASRVMRPIIGWDIGGANIKAARIDDGRAEPLVFERPLPLWREPSRLPSVLTEAADSLGGASTMAVTMTAELADCFATKRKGVASVLDAFDTAFPAVEPWIYGTDGAFRPAAVARRQPFRVARRQLDGERQRRGAAVSRCALHRRRQHDRPTSSRSSAGAWPRAARPIRRGCGAASSYIRVPCERQSAPSCAPLPRRGRRCRVAAEHFAIAADAHLWRGSIEAVRVHVRHAGRPRPKPAGSGRPAGAHGLR